MQLLHPPLNTLGIVSLLSWLLLLGKQLLSNLIRHLIRLFTQESLEAAIHTRGEPKDGVDKINPDRSLHRARAGTLVLVVAASAEEDPSKDSEYHEPGDKEDEIPGKCSVGLEELKLAADKGKSAERCNGDEDHGCGGRETCDGEGKVPLWRKAVVAVAGFANAMAVEATRDESKDKLETATDETWDHFKGLEPSLAHGLAGLRALVEGMATGLSAHFLLIGSAKLGGVACEGIRGLTEFDDGLTGFDCVVESAHCGVVLFVLGECPVVV